MGLEDQEDDALEDGMTTPPVYLTPSRSLSRLRVDTNRVRILSDKYKKKKNQTSNNLEELTDRSYCNLSEFSILVNSCDQN